MVRSAGKSAGRSARVLGCGVALAALLASGCDRAVEPYVPGERPEAPDLSRIFPEGAQQSPGGESPPTRGAAAPPAPPQAPGTEAEAALHGTVRLRSGGETPLPPDAVLFLIARSPAGGPPVAVRRFAAPRFPLAFHLGPEHRMIASLPFEGPFALSARLDADGNASTRQTVDLAGSAAGLHRAGDAGIEIWIEAEPSRDP